MLDGLRDTPLIVYRNGAHQLLGRAHVAEHHANSRIDELRSNALVDRRRHHRESANDFGEIRVCDLRNHQPEQIASAGGQPPGMYILEVFQLPDDFQNAPLGLHRDVAGLVEDAGDRSGRDSGTFGHFPHRVAHAFSSVKGDSAADVTLLWRSLPSDGRWLGKRFPPAIINAPNLSRFRGGDYGYQEAR